MTQRMRAMGAVIALTVGASAFGPVARAQCVAPPDATLNHVMSFDGSGAVYFHVHCNDSVQTVVPPSAGSGTDASANALAVSGTPLTSFVVTNPGQYRVTNECTSTILVALGPVGANPSTQTVLALGPAAASGGQGGDTSPEIPWFTGPVSVYGAAGCPIAARQLMEVFRTVGSRRAKLHHSALSSLRALLFRKPPAEPLEIAHGSNPMDRSYFLRGGALVGLGAAASLAPFKAIAGYAPPSIATTGGAGLVKPGFGTEIANDGTLSARTAARMGGWFNAILDGGAKGDGVTNDFAALTSGYATSFSFGLGFYIPPGTYNIGGNTLIFGGSTNPIAIRGVPGRTFIKSTSNTLNIVQLGNGTALTNGTDGGECHGLMISGPSVPAVQSGQIGLLVNALTHVHLSKIEVTNTDIGLDAINNCYGLHTYECKFGLFEACNVGVNMRSTPNQGCGNQITFDDTWMDGGVAGMHIGLNVDGINVRNGQCGGHAAGLGADSNGCFIIGKEYLSQTAGFTGTVIIDGVDMEGFLGWAIRLYGQANVVIRNCPIISYGTSNGATNSGRGVIKGTGVGNLSLKMEGCSTRGYFNSPVAVSLASYGGGSYGEENSFTDNTVFNGVTCPTQSLFAQSALATGTAIYHDYTAGDLIYTGGSYLRFNSGALQTSPDRATWTAVAGAISPPAVSYLAALPTVAGTAQPFAAFDASHLAGAANSAVASLADLSGFGNTLVEPTSARQPTLSLAAGNSLNALKFNSAGSATVRTTSLVCASISVPLNDVLAAGDFTLIFIFVPEAPVPSYSGQPMGLFLGTTDGENGIGLAPQNYSNQTPYALRGYANSFTPVGGTAATAGAVQKMIVRYQASTGTITVNLNGTTATTGTQAPNAGTIWNALSLGYAGTGNGSPTANMLFCEAILFPALATSAEVTSWQTRNTSKWGGS